MMRDAHDLYMIQNPELAAELEAQDRDYIIKTMTMIGNCKPSTFIDFFGERFKQGCFVTGHWHAYWSHIDGMSSHEMRKACVDQACAILRLTPQ